MTSSKRKQVNVTFAGDDDVMSHIIAINEKYKSSSKKKQKTKLIEEEENVELEEEQDVYKPSKNLADEEDMAGEEVFSFMSGKKKTQMKDVAASSAQMVQGHKSKTPQPIVKSTQGKKHLMDLNNNTPQRLRKRNKPEYVESSSEESGDSSTEDSDSDNDFTKVKSRSKVTESRSKQDLEDVSPSKQKKLESSKSKEETTKADNKEKMPAKTDLVSTKKGRGKQKNIDYEVATQDVQEYFSQQGDANKTSDRTLARLECPRLDQETLNQVLTEVEDLYVQEKEDLNREYTGNFKHWMFHLCNGFNVLLCGVGSKRHLLENFRKQMLKDYTHLVVNGYFPSITIKSILNSITEDLLDHKGSFKNPVDQCEFIRKHFECGDTQEDVYLVLHNIDGAMLRHEKCQTVLSLLANIDGFHIIASIDHINAPLIWDQCKSSRFNWLWQDVTSYAPYSEETSYENSLLVQQSGVLALSSLTHVFKSLTPNARGIFLLVAKYQLDNANTNYTGLAFPDLYQRCREAFLVNSDLTLRTQLTEFRDHKLIRAKKVDGLEYLIIPLDDATLKEFIQQQEEDT